IWPHRRIVLFLVTLFEHLDHRIGTVEFEMGVDAFSSFIARDPDHVGSNITTGLDDRAGKAKLARLLDDQAGNAAGRAIGLDRIDARSNETRQDRGEVDTVALVAV